MAKPARTTITDRDRELLEFLAEHRALVSSQAAVLLGVSERSALTRARKLAAHGLADVQRVFADLPPAVRITRAGLRAIGRQLPEPRLNLEQYRHDIGVGWLWLAARDGAFGQIDQIISEREMRSHDGRPGSEERPHGVGVWHQSGRGPGSDRHYPDLQLQTAGGQRIAVELELTNKSEQRLSDIMFGYSIDRSYQRVLYLTADQQVGERIRRAARRAGISEMVRVQQIAPDGIAGAPNVQSTQRSRSVSRAARGVSKAQAQR